MGDDVAMQTITAIMFAKSTATKSLAKWKKRIQNKPQKSQQNSNRCISPGKFKNMPFQEDYSNSQETRNCSIIKICETVKSQPQGAVGNEKGEVWRNRCRKHAQNQYESSDNKDDKC